MLKSATQFSEVIQLDDSILPANWMGLAQLTGNRVDAGSIEVIHADSPNFKQAIRIGSRLNFHEENEIRIDVPAATSFAAGDVIRLRFWFRCTESLCGDGFILVRIHRDQSPESALAELNISSTSDWTECVLACQIKDKLQPGDLIISFQAGFEMQFVEIGGVQAENLKSSIPLSDTMSTVVSYPGRSSDAGWRELAMQRIESHRKSNLIIRVVDQFGHPVRGATVKIEQVEQAFGFGTCVAANLLIQEGFDNQQYREKIKTLFNRAVFENDMKWQSLGNGMSPMVLDAIDWLHQNGLSIRGHNMVWPSWRWSPAELQQLADKPAELARSVTQHIQDISKYYSNKLTDWDVVNEPFSNHDLMDVLGGNDVMVDWYHTARAANPGCRLCLNDFGILEGGRLNHHRNHFYHTIERMLSKGAPIDSIGIQSHFGTNLPSPIRILEILDQFSSFGLPLESTELSLNLTDRKLQADYLADYVTALYSHPNVSGVLLWGFWSGRHWRPEAALFEQDWTPRPVVKSWSDTRKLFTTNISDKTNLDGEIRCRAFHGKFNISISIDSYRTQHLIELSVDDKTSIIKIF